MTGLPLQVLQNSKVLRPVPPKLWEAQFNKGKERNENMVLGHGATRWQRKKGEPEKPWACSHPLPGCCCILEMDIIWCSGQFKMKILSTSEGRLSLKQLYLEISPNIYSKVCVFPVIQCNSHHCENHARSLHLAHFYLSQDTCSYGLWCAYAHSAYIGLTCLPPVTCTGYANQLIRNAVVTRHGNITQKENKTKDFLLRDAWVA